MASQKCKVQLAPPTENTRDIKMVVLTPKSGIIICQPVPNVNIKLPMRNLLVLIKKSFCGCLIDAQQVLNTLFYKFFDRAEKVNRYMQKYSIWNKM